MDKALRRRNGWLVFTLGMGLYAVLVIAQGFLLEPGAFPLPLMVPLALLPMLPAIWAMTGWLEAVRSMDELQRKILGEAGLFSLGLTAVLTFSYGFLEVYIGSPRLSMFSVWIVIAGAFALGNILARRRYG